ncbi:MAG: GDSL-type esterase/lipase family protein, partial [Pseudomonadota bacterium]
WSALSVRYGQEIDPNAYPSLVFDINGGSSAEMIQLEFERYNSGSGQDEVITQIVMPVQAGGGLTTNSWQTVTVPMVDLNPQMLSFNRLDIQTNSGSSNDFYVDNVRLVAGSGGATPTPTATATATPVSTVTATATATATPTATATATPGSGTGSKKIMMLGDSITNSTCYPPYLYEDVRAGGYTNATFVGTQPMNTGTTGVTCSGTIYSPIPANEGHSGASTGNVITGLSEWLSTLANQGKTPDIVLMHLGTNNFWNGYSAPQGTLNDYTTIVGQLRGANPNVKIVVAQIIPMLYTAASLQCTTDLDAAIPAWRNSITTAQSPVYVVDFETGFDPAFVAGDPSHVHPNNAGAKWMADRVYPILASLL